MLTGFDCKTNRPSSDGTNSPGYESDTIRILDYSYRRYQMSVMSGGVLRRIAYSTLCMSDGGFKSTS